MLVIAADQFVVERPCRGQKLASILAGYPWFADWGRDAMISLPGLCLATGRHEAARAVLELFAGLIDEGMMPNRFEDDNTKLSYNSVDSSLWFIQAARAYGQATGDLEFIHEKLWKAILEIVRRYHSGTRHHIHADADGLIWAGEDGHALTWMDAMHGGVPFTQRRGKAVEINALWLSALGIVADWGETWATKAKLPEAVRGRARTAAAFGEMFWNAEGGYLYDCVDGKNRDARVRPNQLFAVSLPFAPVTGERARMVVGTVRRKLLTPCGVRTLSREDRDYRGRCAGNWFERDFAYHQGTVWPWLLGPYVDALMASAESEFVAHGEAQNVIDNALATLDQGVLGTVAEIFDGDEPHLSRGCFAQAWSVAEILRVKRAYDL
jgi:predicted glycogen debranching enzyme